MAKKTASKPASKPAPKPASKPASKPAPTPTQTPDEKTPVILSGRKGQGYRYCPDCDKSTRGTRIDKCGNCDKPFPQKTTTFANQNARRKQPDAIEAIRTVKEIRGLIEEMGGEDEIRTMLAKLQPLAKRCDGFDNIEQVLNDW